MSLISMTLGRQQKQINGLSKTEALNICCRNHSLGSLVSKSILYFFMWLEISHENKRNEIIGSMPLPLSLERAR
jgi:hypothetical protein